MQTTASQRDDGVERDVDPVAADTSDSSAAFCHNGSTSIPMGPAPAVVDPLGGYKSERGNALEEVNDEKHPAADSVYPTAHPTSGILVDNYKAVEPGLTSCNTYPKISEADLQQPNVESLSLTTPETPLLVSTTSTWHATIAQTQSVPVKRLAQHGEKELSEPIESCYSMGPESAQSSGSLDPITPTNSRVTSGDAASGTADQSGMDSPPASLLIERQRDTSVQTLPALPQNDPSAPSLLLPAPGRESRSSDGFSVFASRAEIYRVFPHFRRNRPRSSTPEVAPRPQDLTIENASTEGEENMGNRDQNAQHSTAEKPRWRQSWLLPSFLRKKADSASSVGHWDRSEIHNKTSGYDSMPPESCLSQENSLLGRPSPSPMLAVLDFGAALGAQLTQSGHADLVDESQHEIGVAQPLGPEQGVLAPLNRSGDVPSQGVGLDPPDGSWQDIRHQRTALTSYHGHVADTHGVDEAQEPIGIARPLGSVRGVLPLPRRSEDTASEVLEAAFADSSWHYVPHLRGGRGRRRRDRFYDPRGDDAPINPWLWWFAGGRPLARDSAPITVGFLRDWRRRSEMTDSGRPRSFGQEFMDTLSDGRMASGRAGAPGMGVGRGMPVAGRGSGRRSQSAPPGGGAFGPQAPGSSGRELGLGYAPAGSGPGIGLGLGDPAASSGSGQGLGHGLGGLPAVQEAQAYGALPTLRGGGAMRPPIYGADFSGGRRRRG